MAIKPYYAEKLKALSCQQTADCSAVEQELAQTQQTLAETEQQLSQTTENLTAVQVQLEHKEIQIRFIERQLQAVEKDLMDCEEAMQANTPAQPPVVEPSWTISGLVVIQTLNAFKASFVFFDENKTHEYTAANSVTTVEPNAIWVNNLLASIDILDRNQVGLGMQYLVRYRERFGQTTINVVDGCTFEINIPGNHRTKFTLTRVDGDDDNTAVFIGTKI
ncbi:hypothetical protein [Lonepinella koalarum]|uniref:hypothetical protein n=1 Tax=Lonepinella koalarum TaxID=53417 RepID=UPI003F6E0C55